MFAFITAHSVSSRAAAFLPLTFSHPSVAFPSPPSHFFPAFITTAEPVTTQALLSQAMLSFTRDANLLANNRTVLRRERPTPFTPHPFAFNTSPDPTQPPHRPDETRTPCYLQCCAEEHLQPTNEPPRTPTPPPIHRPTAAAEWLEAARQGDIPTLSRLIRTNAITDVHLTHPQTAMNAVHYAVIGGHLDTLNALFEFARGVGGSQQHFCHHQRDAINLFAAVDGSGRTALHLAAESLSPDALRMANKLIDYGVNPNALDANGRSAADVALMAGRPDVEQLIRLRSRAAGG